MFLTCCSPRFSNSTSTLPSTASKTLPDTRTPPGSHRASSRAATLTLSVDIPVLLYDHISEVDAHAELERAIRELLLDREGGSNRLDGASELNQEAIARRLHHPPVMLLNGGPDDLPLQGLHLSVSAFLVLTHQRGETDHIGSEDRGLS